MDEGPKLENVVPLSITPNGWPGLHAQVWACGVQKKNHRMNMEEKGKKKKKKDLILGNT